MTEVLKHAGVCEQEHLKMTKKFISLILNEYNIIPITISN